MSKYNRYSEADYRKILQIYESCGGINETARIMEFPRTTVQRVIKRYQTVECFDEEFESSRVASVLPLLQSHEREFQLMRFNYAYVLGMYLGDGHIATEPRTYRMMIYLDIKYPDIIEKCVNSLQFVLPDNRVNIVERHGQNCVYVSCHSNQLPDVFPQHGEGMKHNRDIILENWQQEIIDKYPLEFFRGLYHSDGSRSQNIVKGKNYPRYMFSNYSDDIRKLFTDTAERLGLSWTTANARNVAISKREDVAWLDEHVGEKS